MSDEANPADTEQLTKTIVERLNDSGDPEVQKAIKGVNEFMRYLVNGPSIQISDIFPPSRIDENNNTYRNIE